MNLGILYVKASVYDCLFSRVDPLLSSANIVTVSL